MYTKNAYYYCSNDDGMHLSYGFCETIFNPTDLTELLDLSFQEPKVKLNDVNLFTYLESQ